MDEVEREIRKDKLAAERAFVDQREKMFLEQYPMRHPIINRSRMEQLEVMKFKLEIEAYELGLYFEDTEQT